MIVLIYESGLRLDALCRLEEDADFLLDERAARITGKGRKRRWVFWYDSADAELRTYLTLRRGPLFRATSTKNSGNAMSRDAVRALIKRLASRAGIALPPQAPIHAGRHGFAHAMIDGGVEISEVAQLMGHSDVNTTYRYVQERRDRLHEVHRRAHAKRQTVGSGAEPAAEEPARLIIARSQVRSLSPAPRVTNPPIVRCTVGGFVVRR